MTDTNIQRAVDQLAQSIAGTVCDDEEFQQLARRTFLQTTGLSEKKFDFLVEESERWGDMFTHHQTMLAQHVMALATTKMYFVG